MYHRVVIIFLALDVAIKLTTGQGKFAQFINPAARMAFLCKICFYQLNLSFDR